MKRTMAILMAIMMLALCAGVSLAETATTQTDVTASATLAPAAGSPSLMGRITAIGDSSVTLSVNGNMQPQQNGDGQQGTAPVGNGQQIGNQPPQGGGNQQGGNNQQSGNNQQGGNNQQSGNNPQGGGNSQQGGNNNQQGGNNNQQGGNSQQGAPQGGNQPPQANSAQRDTPDGTQATANGTEKSVTIILTSATTFKLRGSDTAITAADLTVGMMVSVTVTGDETTGYTATAIEADQQVPVPTATAAATN